MKLKWCVEGSYLCVRPFSMDCLQTVTLIIKHTKSDDKNIDISNMIGQKCAGSLPEEIAKERFERNTFLKGSYFKNM